MTDRHDNEMNVIVLGETLPSVRRQDWKDTLMIGVVVALGTVAILGVVSGWPTVVTVGAIVALLIIASSGVYSRMVTRPDHVRAIQSDRMMIIARDTLSYLRRGLEAETASAVCRIVLRETEAVAVAITDLEHVLGFAGLGEDHHRVGGPIITRATQEALDLDRAQILQSKDEIGCPDPRCRLRAAIVVPLDIRDRAVGTLKFYYTSDRYLNENQLAMAEGLGRLLSTQLSLYELDRQTELARDMELKALQAQINPHFLFNTINTIAAFIRTDPGEARRLLRQFGTFYRRTLEQGGDLVTVGQELEFVDTYAELETARFGDRLCLVQEVDPAVLDHPLPSFMLQPLVENAVGHGMRADGSTLTITIAAKRIDGALSLSVSDDGCGISADRYARIFEPSTSKGLGIALGNVRDRLRGHFGPESVFEIESTEGVGTTVTLRIPPLAGADSRQLIDDEGSPSAE